MLTQSTYTYATHEIPLECDVYAPDDHYPETADAPVFLFFHAGGLVGGARTCIPPWLAQVCYQRRWVLVSPSYRLLPQAGGRGLLEDATAAYEFAQSWGASVAGSKRPVIVGGASAGFFMASLIAHHVKPAPAAMLCITGIPTFQHSFFRSSAVLVPGPMKEEQAAKYLEGPVEVGTITPGDPAVFMVNKLLPSGQRNQDYSGESRPADAAQNPDLLGREYLYDYFVYHNAYQILVGGVDPGFQWAEDPASKEKLEAWPTTIFIQGDQDPDVPPEIITSAVDSLGPEKAVLFMARGEEHLFEAESYLEDDIEYMTTVRDAVTALDRAIEA
ncbi:Alpha/Beta hydrolase protein [Xylariaceae sp. FL0804]|nr:Alpha/Beta hydrolase protein [Xylariaceae sp. FL0804]